MLFVEIFSKLPDPRINRTRKHLFLDIIGLALFAVLAGAQSYVEIEDFCRHHLPFLQQYFLLPNGIPSHDTFSRVFSAIHPKAFQECFLSWVKSVIDLLPEQVIAIDGKSLRASRRVKGHLKALHLVSAFSCQNGLSLGQIKVDDKSNEITAVPKLLDQLCLKGAIVTLDAMGCQKAIASQIVKHHGDYVLAVKANQGTLYDALVSTFARADENAYKAMTYYRADDEPNNDHGRLENRQVTVLPLMYLYGLTLPWQGLQSLIRIKSVREIGDEITLEYRYYISSLPAKNPELILSAIRSHWQIENNLHWCLDVIFREDQCRIRDENSAQNFSWLRKTALSLLKRSTHFKGGIRRKQLALWAKPELLLDIVKF